MTGEQGRSHQADVTPGVSVVPRSGLPTDQRTDLNAYVSAFSRSSANSATFLWRSDDGGWQRIQLTAGLDRVIEVEAEPAVLPHRLTARELDVLTLMAIGLSNNEIASFLVASPRTVSTHVEHILAKLERASRAGAAAMAVEQGLLRLPLPEEARVPDGLTICRMHHIAVNGGEVPATAIPGLKEASGRAGRRGALSSPRLRRPLRIGSAFPLGGIGGDDGQQMRNGSALAVAEINARGGIGGRQIEQVVVEVDIFSPDSVRQAFKTLFTSEVDGLTSGYVFPEDLAAGLAGGYGAPYLHAMTSQSQAEKVRDNRSAFRNVFQVCPTEVNYGPGFIRFLNQAEASGWRPANRRIAIVDTDMPSGQMLNRLTLDAAERSGWEIAGARTVRAIGADWAVIVGELERMDPAAVMIAQFLAAELAAFQRQACARLPDTLIYAIYAPSVPEFLQIAGPAAEGLAWATVTGTYSDSIGQRFRAEYQAAFGEPPGWSHAGIAYDEVHLLTHAWRAVGDPRDFAGVSRELRQIRHRGVNGAYFLDNAAQSGLSFPGTTRDPSLGQAHLVLQVQNGVHRIVSPAPYAEARFTPPARRARGRADGTR